MPALPNRSASADTSSRPNWTGSLVPVIGAIAFTLLLGNTTLYILLPQLMRDAVGAGLSGDEAAAKGRLLALVIVAVSCSLGAVACILLDMARRHAVAHTVELEAARRHDMYDSVTGLLRRSRFKAQLRAELAAAPEGAQVIVHLIDIEAFGAINDRHGQEGGDAVLRATAERLASVARPGQIVGRVGADEFALAVITPTVAAGDDNAATLAALLSHPVPHKSGPIAVRVGIGSRIAAARDIEADALIETADLALREAKRCGGARTLAYSADLEAAVQARRALEARLAAATQAADGFEVHYQPICHAADGRLWGYEALVRLPARDDLPEVSPDVFVPVAERLGLIPDIGRRVIAAAIAQAARWPGEPVVSINLSALQFAAGPDSADNLLTITREALKHADLSPQRLVYEITEGRHLNAGPSVLADLKALKEMGVGLALDDFGTGYSTLAYLWAFPFDKLKIDASFVRALEAGDGQARTVLATIVRLGHALGLMVTAEGVETEQQARALRLLGCDLLQGYLYGRPSDADATQADLERGGVSTADAAPGEPNRSDRAVVA